MTSPYRDILLTIADAIELFPLTPSETAELKDRIKAAQNVIFEAWDRMTAWNPELKALGMWPYLAELKENGGNYLSIGYKAEGER